ncbi:hypothetical protein SODALDRAFT_277871 [Sodiomyces alkalinus F11]|uniref:Pheromone a factor receptor n=1 Tax=Sodiomyces alkalinus (strain CBS 110278 / VKM F-3762 / F11) TaxID=1314773 RepID=A0A3N2PWD1_SODAK|nr:hypothetical protein SODALDRAFT_277871 [Sodiomyces alkalinus F11]ROT38797.1 hypothetical protein SODALDRAFT_277871 [Sodiomyces alkalinus F11]
MANLVCRVVLGIIANIICLVPLRLLYRIGEFSAVVFVANMIGLNCLTVINALIWRDDNMTEWWPGYGWCDIHPFLYRPMMTLFTTSVLAISRNLSVQVSMLRAHPLTVREKRRKNLVQALIMFPVPLIQIAWIYPITAQRYTIATLVGCDWRVHRSWPRLVFITLPTPILSLMSGYYAILTYLRYRELRKATRGALSSNSSAISRQNRTRRRLYLLTICILIPYIPLQCAHAALNITETLPLEPFDYHRVRNDENAPYPWNSILLRPSSEINFAFMNNKFISIATAFLVFFLFGATIDARSTYRRYLLAMGFGKLFPRLHEPSYRAAGMNSISNPNTSWATRTYVTSFLCSCTFPCPLLQLFVFPCDRFYNVALL